MLLMFKLVGYLKYKCFLVILMSLEPIPANVFLVIGKKVCPNILFFKIRLAIVNVQRLYCTVEFH